MNAAIHAERSFGEPIWCEGITKRYGGQTVLSNLFLAVAPGSVLGLIGRNGVRHRPPLTPRSTAVVVGHSAPAAPRPASRLATAWTHRAPAVPV